MKQSFAERMVIWTLAKSIRSGRALDARVSFDARFAHQPYEWRRDIWRQAAERAERMVSR